MSRCVVQIWWVSDSTLPERSAYFDLVEMPVPDFEQACILIDGDRLIGAEKLITRRTETKGERVIYNRHPIAFRGCAVARVQLPTYQLTEEASE